MRKRALLALILTFVLIFCLAGSSLAAEGSAIGLETLEEILDYIQTYHISNPNPDTLIHGAIEGLIDSLKDPYTEYLSPEQLKDFKEYLEGNYVGVGIQLQAGENYPKVFNTIENSPAWKAGIKPGDLLIEVDVFDASKEPLEEVVQRIRGPEGTKVRLTIRREGAGDFEIELVRASINIYTVNGEILDDGIGYIRINTFGTKTADEFRKTLGNLILQDARKLILDLRDNPGGLLEPVVQISSNFVEPGQVVVSTVDRNGNQLYYLTEEAPIGKVIPVVALVNHNTASAAEILAGALQDFGVATLIGSQTYGKGTVQRMISLKAGGALLITMAKYHTPKGRVIDGIGLSPDIQVLTPELFVVAAQRYLKHADKNTIVLEIGKSEAVVNGSAVPLRQMVLERSGIIYLPLRFAFEALGYQVDWQPADKSIKITGFKSEVVFYPEDRRVTVGGENIPGAELLFEDGAAYIPLPDLSLFNINVKLDGSNISIDK